MAKNSLTPLDETQERGYDLKNRIIYFGENPSDFNPSEEGSFNAFTSISVENTIRAIHRMSSDYPKKPIELHMSTDGGDVYAMFRLMDAILTSPCQIKFFGSGIIASSGTWILAVCDERYLHKNTTIMVHSVSDAIEGTQSDRRINQAESERLQSLLEGIFEDNTRMPKDFWKQACQRDLYLTAKEAIQLGMADKIVEHKKRGNLRKARQHALKSKVNQKTMQNLVNRIYDRIGIYSVPEVKINDISEEAIDERLTIDNTPVPEPEIPPTEEIKDKKED